MSLPNLPEDMDWNAFFNSAWPPAYQFIFIQSCLDRYEQFAKVGVEMVSSAEEKYFSIGMRYHKLPKQVRLGNENYADEIPDVTRVLLEEAYEITSVTEYDRFFRPWKDMLELCNQIFALAYKSADLADMKSRGQRAYELSKQVEEIMDGPISGVLGEINDAVDIMAHNAMLRYPRFHWWLWRPSSYMNRPEWTSYKAWMSTLPSTQRWLTLGENLDDVAHRELVDDPEEFVEDDEEMYQETVVDSELEIDTDDENFWASALRILRD